VNEKDHFAEFEQGQAAWCIFEIEKARCVRCI